MRRSSVIMARALAIAASFCVACAPPTTGPTDETETPHMDGGGSSGVSGGRGGSPGPRAGAGGGGGATSGTGARAGAAGARDAGEPVEPPDASMPKGPGMVVDAGAGPLYTGGQSVLPSPTGPLRDTWCRPRAAAPATDLDGITWAIPCNPNGRKRADRRICDMYQSFWDLNVWTARTFSGDPRTTYDVTFHVRGVVEGKMFLDESGRPIEPSGTSPVFLRGGRPVSSGGEGGYQTFGIRVSDPPGQYWVNAVALSSHEIYALDYNATIAVRGGATVTFSAIKIQDHMVRNHRGLVIAGACTQGPFDGTFLELEVASVEAR